MDVLAHWRAEFPILDTCTYLVSHSLGAMPTRARRYLTRFADEWDHRGVRAWSEGWWEIGRETGNLLAPIVGAPPDTITMHQNATVAQSIVASCFSYEAPRRKILLQDLDFPTNHYLYEGFRRFGAEIVYAGAEAPAPHLQSEAPAPHLPSEAPALHPDGAVERMVAAIDERTVLVPISLVLFRSGTLQDVAPVVEKAHRVGAHVVLDMYQAAGTVPVDVTALGVDFAVGGSVKWLCGGPGAGYLYVRPDLLTTMKPSVVGWAGHDTPFAFETGAIRYATGVDRFQSGTPNVPSLYSARAGYEIVAEIGVPAIREKSLRLTRRLMDAAERRGWRLNTPGSDSERGGSVVIDVPDADMVTERLLAANVIVDYRPHAGIRMAPHFYNTEGDIDRAIEVMDETLAGDARQVRS